MAIIQISKIQHRTGANVDLPQLSEGELGFATDEQKLYIGNDPLLHPPANNDTTTQVEILTEISTLQHAKLEGSANTALNLADTYPGQVMVLGPDGNTWINAGGNVLDPGNTAVIPNYGVHLGDASNIKLTGGVNGFVLQTDGQGNLSWTSAGIIQYVISNITKANPAVVTTSNNNLITTGVPITITGVGGMTQIKTAGENGTNKFYAKRVTNTTFELYKDTAFTTAVDSTSFTTATYDANSLVTVSFYSQGTGSPGGANNQVQLNDGTGSFAGSANLTFSRITNQLTVTGNVVANVVTANSFRGAVTGSIGATTPNTGAFTSITSTTTASVTGNIIGGNISTGGTLTVTGNASAGNVRITGLANVGDLNVNSNVTSNLSPNANVTYNLGSATQNWKDVFVGNLISLNAQSITANSTTTTITGNLKVSNASLGNLATANYVTGTLTTNAQPNITSVGTLSNLTVSGPVNLGDVSNLTIGGRSPNYVLTVTPDGSRVNWLPTQQVITNPGGVDTQVQFNDNSTFGGNTKLTFNKLSGVLTTVSIAGEGGNLSNIQGANVSGTVATATRAGTVTTNAQPNITSVGTLTTIAVTGNANVGNLGTSGLITATGNITGGNLTTSGSLSVTGNANAGNIGATIGVFTGNISSQNLGVSNLVTTNTLTVNTTATIANITAGNINITGNTISGNLSTGGTLSVTGNAGIGNLNVGAIVAVGQLSTTDNLLVNGNANVGNLNTGRGTFSGNVSAGNLSTTGNLNVSGSSFISNLNITGTVTGALLPSANVTYNLGSPTQRWKDLYLSGSTIYLGAAGQLTTDTSGALTLGGDLTTTANINAGNVSTGNITGSGSATVTGNVIAGNVYANSGTIGATNLIGALTTAAQPNITSVGRLTALTVGNSTNVSVFGNGTISSNSISINGNILLTSTTPVIINGSVGTNGQVLSTTGTGVQWITLSPNTIFNGTSNVSVSSSGGNVTVSVGGTPNVAVVSPTGVNIAGSLSATSLKLPGGTAGQALISDGAGGIIFGSGKAYAVSNVNSLIAGSALVFDIDYGNTQYPAGVFTLKQLGPVTFSVSDTWSSGGTSKNAYNNGVASVVNVRDIVINLSLANATFAINTATDSISIGGTTIISGATLAALNIANNAGGTYTIPNSMFASSSQTNSGVVVAVTLTTSRGPYSASGTILTNNQYSPFSVSFNGNWGGVTSVPYFAVTRPLVWSSTVTGTVNSGNLIYTQVGNTSVTGTLTSVGATSGSSTSLDSTFSYTISTTDYVGLGANVVSGTATVSTSTTVAATTKYYPLFYKITSSSANPNFTTVDSYLPKAFALGDGANTSAITSQYLWLAVPGAAATRAFQHTDLTTVDDVPVATYTNQTIGGYTYQVYGFTNFNRAVKISVVT